MIFIYHSLPLCIAAAAAAVELSFPFLRVSILHNSLNHRAPHLSSTFKPRLKKFRSLYKLPLVKLKAPKAQPHLRAATTNSRSSDLSEMSHRAAWIAASRHSGERTRYPATPNHRWKMDEGMSTEVPFGSLTRLGI